MEGWRDSTPHRPPLPPYARPRELEALRIVEQRPGITIAELADKLGVSMQRVWQIVGRLEVEGREVGRSATSMRTGWPGVSRLATRSTVRATGRR